MGYQMVFQRYEIKYLLTKRQKEALLEAMAPYIAPDRYARSSIRNLYFDTENYRLVRRSNEKPVYKEKLRIRSYGKCALHDEVFVELKKKSQGVVYKRRMTLEQEQALNWLTGKIPCPSDTQIAREIDYFVHYYGTMAPRVFLSYERESYHSNTGDNLRITFDDAILSRTDDLLLNTEPRGVLLLQKGLVLMELKTSGALPLWMTHLLAEQQLFKASFSKYGTAYQTIIFPNQEGRRLYA